MPEQSTEADPSWQRQVKPLGAVTSVRHSEFWAQLELRQVVVSVQAVPV